MEMRFLKIWNRHISMISEAAVSFKIQFGLFIKKGTGEHIFFFFFFFTYGKKLSP